MLIYGGSEVLLMHQNKCIYLLFFFGIGFNFMHHVQIVAQRLGLVEAPELLLSENQWKEVKEKSNSRQDSALPCVICKEDFGLQQQVRILQVCTMWAPTCILFIFNVFFFF